MTAYRLHYFPGSGNSYKLALMLTLCGQAFEPVWTDFGGGYDLSKSHPAVWLSRIAAIPEWRSPYDLLRGERLRCYVNS